MKLPRLDGQRVVVVSDDPHKGMLRRVEYGVRCRAETFWLPYAKERIKWRPFRWLKAHWMAWSANRDMSEMFGCGRHTVVTRNRYFHQ